MVLGARNLNVAEEQRYWGKAQDLCCSNTGSDGRWLSVVFYHNSVSGAGWGGLLALLQRYPGKNDFFLLATLRCCGST